MDSYDVAIIDTGAAGVTAAIYVSRYELKTALFGIKHGGAAADASIIENYPGFTQISGPDFTEKLLAHARYFNIPIIEEEIKTIKKAGKGFVLKSNANQYQAKTIILAQGSKRRELKVPGEKEFLGRGVSFCFTCDAPFFKGKVVAIVGGGDAGAMGAVQLAGVAPKVYWIYRKAAPRAMPTWQDKVRATGKVTELPERNITEIRGDQVVKSIILDKPFRGSKELPLAGVFVEIGAEPDRTLIDQLKIETTKIGHIKVDSGQHTNIPAVFAAGDITTGSDKYEQIVTAAAEGSIAAHSAYLYLLEKRKS